MISCYPLIQRECWSVVLHTIQKLPKFDKFLVHRWSLCGGWNEEHSVLVHGSKLIFIQTESGPQQPDIQSSSFKSPHQLEACAENLLNMESSVLYAKRTISRPMLQLN